MTRETERERGVETPFDGLEAPTGHREFVASVQRLAGVGVWCHDPATDETRWSERAREICGIGRTHPTVAGLVDRHTRTDRSAVEDWVTGAAEGDGPFEVEAELAREGSTRRTIRLRCEPRETGEGGVALYGVVEDITDEVRTERRIEVLRRTSKRLKEADSRQGVADILADASKNILGLVNTTVRLVDRRDNTLRPVVATEECVERAGERPSYPISEATPAARTYRTGDPELHTDHRATEDDYDRGELRSGLYVPVGSHGVLSAGDVVVNAFDEADLEAAGLLGQLGAEAFTRIGLTKRPRAI
ncbi:GAF domain-containing protein [Halogeometricum luteum]|uniref:GAF domain-containing protein n=1 Tax=Halogeometricum luteum TaxID=2950537 RepID=A0ABU2G3X6_9EURY|nr:GAF domain-containing protein [Halogeometricum sp. S3BR5-2]MDS0295497.1 GAF domain-containing protein [Halogeometricum sp. S3BR5-2]